MMKRFAMITLPFILAACTSAIIPKEDYGFEQSGTLTRNTPGLTPGVWYLHYEAPQQPALTMRLSFDDDTQCIKGEEKDPCERSIFEQGLHVTVRGEEVNGGVEVKEMELE